MFAEPSARPVSLRVHLRSLQAALDEAAAANLAHRRDHGCREGSGCPEGRELAAAVTGRQAELGMTRFLNDDS
jgi:hypothetical protein